MTALPPTVDFGPDAQHLAGVDNPAAPSPLPEAPPVRVGPGYDITTTTESGTT